MPMGIGPGNYRTKDGFAARVTHANDIGAVGYIFLNYSWHMAWNHQGKAIGLEHALFDIDLSPSPRANPILDFEQIEQIVTAFEYLKETQPENPKKEIINEKIDLVLKNLKDIKFESVTTGKEICSRVILFTISTIDYLITTYCEHEKCDEWGKLLLDYYNEISDIVNELRQYIGYKRECFLAHFEEK